MGNDKTKDDKAGKVGKQGQGNRRKKPFFNRFANAVAKAAGNPITFCVMSLMVVVWAACGPVFGYSETWQLVINTSTTIITFLMVFVIQNTQNRDSHAVQLKLDEIIRSIKGAHNELLDIEELGEKELCRMRDRYEELACKARQRMSKSQQDDVDYLEDLDAEDEEQEAPSR